MSTRTKYLVPRQCPACCATYLEPALYARHELTCHEWSDGRAFVVFAGVGRGYFVRRRVTIEGYPQTVTLAGPFADRARAFERAVWHNGGEES